MSPDSTSVLQKAFVMQSHIAKQRKDKKRKSAQNAAFCYADKVKRFFKMQKEKSEDKMTKSIMQPFVMQTRTWW